MEAVAWSRQLSRGFSLLKTKERKKIPEGYLRWKPATAKVSKEEGTECIRDSVRTIVCRRSGVINFGALLTVFEVAKGVSNIGSSLK